jgi:hypothetical protein
MKMVGTMHPRVKRNHPALKHGAYSAIAVLPGESRAAFDKLHRDLIADHAPSWVLEYDTVATLARLLWRKQNLDTLHIAERARNRRSEIINKTVDRTEYVPPLSCVEPPDPVKQAAQMRAAEEQTPKELGDAHELITIGEAATFDGLTKELDVKERLDACIDRCLKRLLFLKGFKSISGEPASVSPKRIPGPSRAA